MALNELLLAAQLMSGQAEAKTPLPRTDTEVAEHLKKLAGECVAVGIDATPTAHTPGTLAVLSQNQSVIEKGMAEIVDREYPQGDLVNVLAKAVKSQIATDVDPAIVDAEVAHITQQANTVDMGLPTEVEAGRQQLSLAEQALSRWKAYVDLLLVPGKARPLDPKHFLSVTGIKLEEIEERLRMAAMDVWTSKMAETSGWDCTLVGEAMVRNGGSLPEVGEELKKVDYKPLTVKLQLPDLKSMQPGKVDNEHLRKSEFTTQFLVDTDKAAEAKKRAEGLDRFDHRYPGNSNYPALQVVVEEVPFQAPEASVPEEK